MQESVNADTYNKQKLVGILAPIALLCIVAILSPFAILLSNNAPPYYPPPPGWDSWVTIYLWTARFSIGFFQERYSLEGGVTNLHALLFVIMTIIYFEIQIATSIRKMQAKYSITIDGILFLVWVTVCQLIYGTFQDWTLIQVPVIPLAGISILLVSYGIQSKR
jgi:hypothetical protein